ncbi:MAG: hypothetical protein USCAAHI_00017 [Beijerinckiaceae bacterium]|nr:MAG: hypothetical protein USCAAHI_00017 [Beijerinckiaceae bacterium]
MTSVDDLFKSHPFDRHIIVLCAVDLGFNQPCIV